MSRLGPVHPSALIPELLRELTAVVVAVLDMDGRLVDCNRGFLALIGDDVSMNNLDDVRHLFVRPAFQELKVVSEHDQEPVYTGILNIGDVNLHVRSIKGTVYQRGGRLLLVGEHDIADLERLNATVIELNEESAGMQRDLVRANRQLQTSERRMHDLMLTDSLTQVPNRRHFNERILEELSRARRYGTPLTLLISDIDHFKYINDDFGHDVGDVVLQSVAQNIQKNLRQSDFLARFGGEEFVMIFPETDIDQGELIGDKVRRVLSSKIIPEVGRAVTASFGLSELSQDDDVNSLLKRADLALYHAKEAGRNRLAREDVSTR